MVLQTHNGFKQPAGKGSCWWRPTLEPKCPTSRKKDARGDTDAGSSYTCLWSLIPPRGSASHQVRVPVDAPLQSPRVHDDRTRRREGIVTWTLLTSVHGTQHHSGVPTATRLGSPMTLFRVHVFTMPEQGGARDIGMWSALMHPWPK